MMELQQAALDVRTREHSRRVDDANRNGWLRPVPRRVNPSVQPSHVLGAVSSWIASNISVGRKSGLPGRLAGSVTSERALGTV
jgi:hypothetical protein